MLDCTISINRGKTFTNQRKVTISSNVANATDMRLGNAGGLANSVSITYTRELSWTLADPGKRIATMIVYARFTGANGLPLCGGVSLIDDIIYDPISPAVQVKPIKPINKTGPVTVTVSLDAYDQEAGSGLTRVQYSKRSDFAGSAWQTYSPEFDISAQSGDYIYVRVDDAAGNVSTSQYSIVGAPGRVYLPM